MTIRQHLEDTSQAELHHRAAEQGQKRHGPDEAMLQATITQAQR